MSEALRPASSAAVAALDKLKAYTENPFRCLPEEWIPIVATFVIAKGRLIGTPTSFCATVNIQRCKGLTLAGLKAVLSKISDANVAQNHRFDTDLLADFHAWCAVAIRNQKLHDQKKREEEAERESNGNQATILRIADSVYEPAPLAEPKKQRKGQRA